MPVQLRRTRHLLDPAIDAVIENALVPRASTRGTTFQGDEGDG